MDFSSEEDLLFKKLQARTLVKMGVNSINDLEPHLMEWGELRSAISHLLRGGRNMLDDMSDKTSTAEMHQIESVSDVYLEAVRLLEHEADIREEIGDRSPRSQKETPAQLSKRPGVDPATCTPGGGTVIEEDRSNILKPEQRMATWLQDRGLSQALPGLSLGRYLRSMVNGAKTDVERRALSEGSDSAGGYTVPTVLSAQLIDRARAASVCVRAGAQTLPLTSDRHVIAKVLTDPTPGWRLEEGLVAESDPTFGSIELTPRSLAVQMQISAELMADSLNLEVQLPNIVASAMAAELDRVCLMGTGTAPQPRGVANTTGIGTFAQDAAITDYANLSKARTGILTANRGPVSAYIMHPRDEGAFVDRTDGNGQPLMPHPAVGEIPILTTTSIPTDGGSGSDESTIFAGNFAGMLIGIRQDIRVEVLKFTKYADNLQYTLVAHMRGDVAVVDPAGFYTLTGVQG